MSGIRPAVLKAWHGFSSPLENTLPYPYLDIRGLVTVATGNLIDPIGLALDIPWTLADGSPAPRDVVIADWKALKARPDLANKHHSKAAAITRIRLTPKAIEDLVFGKLHGNHVELRKHFSQIDDMPADVQLVLHSISWACGAAFSPKWPRFSDCIRRGDYHGASKNCSISHITPEGVVNGGVIPRNYLNMAHLLAAVIGDAPAIGVLDPEKLAGPCTLDQLDDWALRNFVKFATPMNGRSQWNWESANARSPS